MSMEQKKFIKTLGSKLVVEDIPVVLECGINGSVTKAKNPNAPETVEEHIAEMIRVLDAGATIAHNHSNQWLDDPEQAAQFYMDVFGPVREKYPHAIIYATVNIDAKALHEERRPWAPGKMAAHHRVLAKAGLANMVLFETGVAPVSVFDKDGIAKDDIYFVYQFWPEDNRYTRQICTDFGTGAAFSVYEPGWMKNIIAMARAGTLPRGSKLNLYFGADNLGAMAPPIPEALELYLKMMEGAGLEVGGLLPWQRRECHGYAAGPNGTGAWWEPSSRSRGRHHRTEQCGADRTRQKTR